MHPCLSCLDWNDTFAINQRKCICCKLPANRQEPTSFTYLNMMHIVPPLNQPGVHIVTPSMLVAGCDVTGWECHASSHPLLLLISIFKKVFMHIFRCTMLIAGLRERDHTPTCASRSAKEKQNRRNDGCRGRNTEVTGVGEAEKGRADNWWERRSGPEQPNTTKYL